MRDGASVYEIGMPLRETPEYMAVHHSHTREHHGSSTLKTARIDALHKDTLIKRIGNVERSHNSMLETVWPLLLAQRLCQ